LKISRKTFEAQRARRFGASNPERMNLGFWEAMVRNAEDARIMDDFDPERAELCYYPHKVRQHFGIEGDYSVPIWTFSRMGASRTPHPDGRMICIGGEHEDYYDPDFCIYNDVVILDLDGSIAIYGYPRDVFPPTDFHTATLDLDRNRVIVIGRLGYGDERRPGVTPVFALSLADYRITPLPSVGEAPGWIFKHEAESAGGVITVRGGELVRGDDEIRRNFDDFAYDIQVGTWIRLTDRKWRQYEIGTGDHKVFMLGPPFRGCAILGDHFLPVESSETDDVFLYVLPGALRPRGVAHEVETPADYARDGRFIVAGIPVVVSMKGSEIELVIEGDMNEALADAVAEAVRASVEADVGRACVLTKYS
jgi:hypothetical protein